jgi:cytochrome c biogenesis protein CcdA
VKGAGILTLASFTLGIVVSVGEFLCTGQIYLATIIMMIRNNPVFDLKTMEYFVLYGIALVTPLLVLCIILYKGREMFQVSEKMRENMPWIKLANALLFLLFGIVIFFKF